MPEVEALVLSGGKVGDARGEKHRHLPDCVRLVRVHLPGVLCKVLLSLPGDLAGAPGGSVVHELIRAGIKCQFTSEFTEPRFTWDPGSKREGRGGKWRSTERKGRRAGTGGKGKGLRRVRRDARKRKGKRGRKEERELQQGGKKKEESGTTKEAAALSSAFYQLAKPGESPPATAQEAQDIPPESCGCRKQRVRVDPPDMPFPRVVNKPTAEGAVELQG